MRIKALSHYDGDKITRFGDCILGFNNNKMIVYDCGHEKHADAVSHFLEENVNIKDVSIVISHNDSDHTDGVLSLMNYLKDNCYEVTVFTSLYLKSVNAIHDMLDDGRRKKNKTCEHILDLFEHIADIVTSAEEFGFTVKNALPDTDVGLGTIVGPTEDEFVQVVAKAIEDNGQGHIDGETVMNAASVQLKCTLDDGKNLLLCGDASPEYIHDMETYDIIQFPHHGQLKDAKAILDKLEDPYTKEFLISDNTGCNCNSGGSDDLVKMMRDERYSPAHNTKNKIVNLPKQNTTNSKKTQGVILGGLDCKC